MFYAVLQSQNKLTIQNEKLRQTAQTAWFCPRMTNKYCARSADNLADRRICWPMTAGLCAGLWEIYMKNPDLSKSWMPKNSELYGIVYRPKSQKITAKKCKSPKKSSETSHNEKPMLTSTGIKNRRCFPHKAETIGSRWCGSSEKSVSQKSVELTTAQTPGRRGDHVRHDSCRNEADVVFYQ